MRSDNIILRAENLDIGYSKKSGDKVVLRNINAELVRGEMVCLIGPNGVGKSTLLRTLCGVQKPLAGQVYLNGKVIHQYDRHRLAKEISLVLTEKVTGNLTVHELITLGRYPHTDWTGAMKKDDDEHIEKAIAGTHCEEILNQKVYELSDGQMQKALIARALAQDGNIMILDEPSAHLDLKNKVEILMLLKNLANEHQKAMLIATHELDLAMQIADRLWLMAYDQPFRSGCPEDLAIDGHISAAFESKGFQFDLGSGKIKVNRVQNRFVKVVGKGKEYFWLCHALDRAGLGISNESNIVVTALQGRWHTSTPEREKIHSSIDQVLKELGVD
jgi:iron complex transport system ATP-binding protein